MNTTENKLLALAVTLALFWLGLLAGVSFLATPVKFMAPSLSLPVALDVGRQTFSVFNPLELLLGVLLLAAALYHYRAARVMPRIVVMSLVLLGLVLSQTLWLLPVLDARVEIILQGGTPSPSSLHRVYIVVDLLKLVLLGTVASAGRILLRDQLK